MCAYFVSWFTYIMAFKGTPAIPQEIVPILATRKKNPLSLFLPLIDRWLHHGQSRGTCMVPSAFRNLSWSLACHGGWCLRSPFWGVECGWVALSSLERISTKITWVCLLVRQIYKYCYKASLATHLTERKLFTYPETRHPNTSWGSVFGPQKHTNQTPNLRRYLDV